MEQSKTMKINEDIEKKDFNQKKSKNSGMPENKSCSLD